MKILLSPTKKQIFTAPNNKGSTPVFINKAEKLMDRLRILNHNELKTLLGTSDNLTSENLQRNQVWRANPSVHIGVTTIFTYKGEAFNYLNPNYFNDDDLLYANKNLRIFSGLYGLLKPLDTIMPYRLDIKDKIDMPNYKSLYQFWSGDITKSLKNEIELDGTKILLNVSSVEYSKTVKFKDLPVKVITPEFKTEVNGKLKTIAIFSKRMRGLMAREVITNRYTTEDDLKSIEFEDYELVNVEDDRYLYIKR